MTTIPPRMMPMPYRIFGKFYCGKHVWFGCDRLALRLWKYRP